MHPLLAFHLQHSGLGQQSDVPVHGGLGHVGQVSAQVGGRADAPAGNGVHDPQPDWVQKQVRRVHDKTIPHLVLLPNWEMQIGSRDVRTAAPGKFLRGGRSWRLLLYRSGRGRPAVVILPGGGAVGLDYLNVQELAAKLSTSVVYDRAGTGWSERTELPRTCAEVTEELRELLQAAAVPAPYLLVGHSLGGLYARYYATRFPGDVAALLLIGGPMRTTTPTCPWSSTTCARHGIPTRRSPMSCRTR